MYKDPREEASQEREKYTELRTAIGASSDNLILTTPKIVSIAPGQPVGSDEIYL